MSRNGTVLLGGRGASPRLARLDPRFAPLYERFGPARVHAGRDPFASIVEAIASQQLSVAAGRTVYGRVEAACAGRVTPKRLAAAGPERLRACGLSRPKTGYVLDLAQRCAAGDLALADLEERDDDEVVSALTEVKGIGEWTAQMLLMFTFHRPDVLPTKDLGIVDGTKLVCGLKRRPTERQLTRIADAWRPLRSVACWYIWHERDRVMREKGARA